MSYSTRRQTGRGVSNTQTQVNYHQPPMGRGAGRPGPNQGYSTTNAQSYQQQFVSQGYSTVPPPAPPVQKVTAAPSPVQPPQPPAPQPPVQEIKPEPSKEVVANPEQPKETNGEGKTTSKPFWMKGPAVKISRKTRKRRQNARLRRLLIPKNALMFLNELHPQANFTCQGCVNALNQYVYTVTVEIDGKVFTGQGMSKLAAKAQASEDALKVLVLEKMAKAQMENLVDPNISGDDVEMEEDTKESEAGDDDASDVTKPRRKFPEDDMPWGSLAAFALHKLFTDWQQQGSQLPMSKASVISPPPTPIPAAKSGVPNPMKKIPEDARKRHPVTLLNYLKPGSTYRETHEGMPPNMVFTITVDIDGKDYVGTGTNKKEARRECAKAALAAMGIPSEV